MRLSMLSRACSSPGSSMAKRSSVGFVFFMLRRLVRGLLPSMRVVRLSAYLFVVFSVLGLVAARAVLADMSEAGLRAGREVAKFSRIAGPAERILLNGESFRHGSNYVKESVTQVLDKAEEHCRAHL